MARIAAWGVTAALAVVAVIGIVGLIANGSCGCANSNYVCAVQPCPSSDTLYFVCVFVGSFGASIMLTAAIFIGHNARLRAYQRRQPPVTAEMPAGSLETWMAVTQPATRRTWSTPPVSPPASDERGNLSRR